MSKQIVLVVGGPGKSGSTTIAKMLAEYFDIERINGGKFCREEAKAQGYEDYEDFLKESSDEVIHQTDVKVDEKLRRTALRGSVLIESKIFAAIATKEDIPCSAKIWLDADLDTRVERALAKEKISNPIARWFKKREIKNDLIFRYEVDKVRYEHLYNIEYDHPEKYNDLVIDNSDQTVDQTFNLIINFLKDAGIKKQRDE
jgi:cytidylate kinase